MRQLPEAAGLQQRRGDARQAAPRRLRGAALLPPLLDQPYPSTSPLAPMCMCMRFVIL